MGTYVFVGHPDTAHVILGQKGTVYSIPHSLKFEALMAQLFSYSKMAARIEALGPK